MRTFCRLFVVLTLVSCSIHSKAVIIRTQDPNYTSITTTPSSFRFSLCPTSNDANGPYLDNGNTVSADGCFGGVNEVRSTITSLTLSFPDTPAIQNSGQNAAQSDIFSMTSVTETNGILSFMFTGGNLIQGQTFVVTEDGVSDLSQFPTVTLSYTTAGSTAVTPEPAPALLVATGMLCMGGLFLERRRRDV